MRPRLKEVAARAGVSEATVSRVVNGRRGVAARTRVAVQRALNDMGYDPRGITLPRVDAGDRTNGVLGALVGLVVPELENPVFPAFAQAIERRLSARGITTVLATATLEGTPEHRHIASMRARGVDGFAFVSGLHAATDVDHAEYHRLAEEGTPMVLVNGALPDLAVPSVSADDLTAAQVAVRHLADLGHRHIGLAAGPLRYTPMLAKLEGYRRGLADVGGHESVAETVFTLEGGHLAATRLLAAGATAIIAGSDLMALGAIRAVRDAGLDVPGDVSVVGYDDTGYVAYADPPLTTLRQPIAEMGATAADALADALSGSPHEAGDLLFAPELVVRASTAPGPALASD